MRRTVGILLFAVLAAACGGDQDPTVEDAAASSTTVADAVPGPDETTTTPDGDTAPPAAEPGDPVGTEPVDNPAPTAPPAPTTPSADAPAIPAAGRYTFHTTGTADGGVLGGGRQAIDQETVTVVAALGPDTVRETSASPMGDQITELRYEAGRVAMLLLDLGLGSDRVRFSSAAGETFTPLPPTEGQTWSWQLTDEGGSLTLAFTGATAPGETITVAGGAVAAAVIDATIRVTGTYQGFPVDATIQVRSWVDPDRRMAVQTHQISDTVQPIRSHSDTTSVFTGFTPA